MSATFIAEIKTKSPFGYTTNETFVSLMQYAIKYGDWISVHTNALWGGDYDALSFVRNNTDKPILAKGLHKTDDDIKRALDHGADYVLVVDRIPNFHYWNKVLFEFSTIEGFTNAMETIGDCFHPLKFVYNSRDLRTGLPKKLNEIDKVIALNQWTCQASNIVSPADVNPNVQAFIVGECLIDYCKTSDRIS